jgi:pheromone shutdown protein TraB
LLVGDSQENNQLKKDGFIGKSTQAYKRIYPKIAEALLNNTEVFITYKDIA